MVERMARVRQLRELPDDDDVERPEPGWRRRLERATVEGVSPASRATSVPLTSSNERNQDNSQKLNMQVRGIIAGSWTPVYPSQPNWPSDPGYEH